MTHEAILLRLVERLSPQARSFADLSAWCMGAWPGAIAEALYELGRLGRLARSDRLRLLGSARRQAGRGLPRHDARLPLPHPLDQDWRFTSGSTDALLAVAARLSPAGRRLLLVCAPTVAFRAALLTPRWRVTVLARMSDPVVAALSKELGPKVDVVDVEDGADGLEADVAIADPPWYDDIAFPLLGAATAGLRRGGMLLCCYPDALTGAGRAASLTPDGLRQADPALAPLPSFTMRVRYETPLFEANALRALGLPGHHPRWRTGRVLAARKVRLCGSRDGVPLPSWTEVTLGDLGRLSAADAGAAARAHYSVVSSVSRMHPHAPARLGGHPGTVPLADGTRPSRTASRLKSYSARWSRPLACWTGQGRFGPLRKGAFRPRH